jgi:hypothetical protein
MQYKVTIGFSSESPLQHTDFAKSVFSDPIQDAGARLVDYIVTLDQGEAIIACEVPPWDRQCPECDFNGIHSKCCSRAEQDPIQRAIQGIAGAGLIIVDICRAP